MKAIITGASKGMGKYFAKELAMRGYDLILIARSMDLLYEIKNDLEKAYKIKVTPIGADLSKVKESKDLALRLVMEDVDILINNAGFGIIKNFFEMDEEYLRKMTNLNLVTLQMWNNIFIKRMILAGGGIIVNIASVAGEIPMFAGNLPYALNKQYVRYLSKGLQLELKKIKSKVRVVSVQPGQIKTNWAATASENKVNDMGTPADVFAKKVISKVIDKKKNDIWAGKASLQIRIATKLMTKKAFGKITSKVIEKSYK